MPHSGKKRITSGVPELNCLVSKRGSGGGAKWSLQRINIPNTHHVIQADTPAFKENLSREAIDECKPDLCLKKKKNFFKRFTPKGRKVK